MDAQFDSTVESKANVQNSEMVWRPVRNLSV